MNASGQGINILIVIIKNNGSQGTRREGQEGGSILTSTGYFSLRITSPVYLLIRKSVGKYHILKYNNL